MTYDQLQESFQVKRAIFSAWTDADCKKDMKWDEWDSPDTFLDDIPDRVIADVPRGILVYASWTKTYEEPFEGALTWRKAMTFFDKAITETKEGDHVFLEGVDQDKKTGKFVISSGS